VPVIAFAEGGGSTDLIAEIGGPLVAMTDTDSMAEAACRLLRDEPARRAISVAAERRLEQGFGYSEYASALLATAYPTDLTVSVVVPNYNYARYLHNRIKSIREQTYPVLEIILLDDASTDESLTVISELEKTCPDLIRVERNETNSGSVVRQWARGVSLASGDLIWIAEADDFAEPALLDVLVPAFEDPDVVLSYCESRQIDAEGRVLADNYLAYVADIDPTRWRADYRRDGPKEIAEALSVKNTIPNVSAAVFRRDAIARVLRDHFEEMMLLRNTADWCCYIRLLAQGSIAFRQQPLNHHRRHGGGVTISNSDRRHLEEIGAMQRLSAAVVSVPPKYQELAARWRAQVAQQFNLELSALGTVTDR
jgi:hypothetical protein